MLHEAIQYWPTILRNVNLPLRKFIHLGTKTVFSRGERIGGDMSPPGIFYLVHRGMVRFFYPTATGEEKVICYIGENTIFNEVPAAFSGRLCAFSCVERLETTAFDINLLRSHEIISQHPEIALSLLEASMQKCALYYHQLTSLGAYSAFTNVCRLLYSICLHNKKGDRIVPYISKQDFASIVSIHRGSLHKCLTQLKTEGIIESYSKRELVVLDMEKLREYALANN